MTKQAAPRPEPLYSEEELTKFFDDFVDDDSAIEQEQINRKKPRFPAKNTSMLGRNTTDGFRRIVQPKPPVEKAPAESPVESPVPAEEPIQEPLIEEEDHSPKRNPSVKNPGRIMDFVPNRAKVAAPAPKPSIKTTRIVKSTTTIVQNVPDIDDFSELDDLSKFDDMPVDEDEMASALSDFAEPDNITSRKNRYTADEYDDDDYHRATDVPPRRRTDGYKERNILEYEDDSFNLEDDYDDLDDIASGFSEEPKPFNPDNLKKTIHRTPFLTSVVVEKRPLSPYSQPSFAAPANRVATSKAPAVKKSYNIPAPVDRPLSNTSKKSYKSSYESAYESRELNRNARGKSSFTMSTPKDDSSSLPVFLAVFITIILGAAVGAAIYLAFFNK